jgi:hypothetical protein
MTYASMADNRRETPSQTGDATRQGAAAGRDRTMPSGQEHPPGIIRALPRQGSPTVPPRTTSDGRLAPLIALPVLVHEPKSRRTAILLCLFLGWLGCHRFYVGKRSTARLYLLTGGLFFIGVLVDLVLLLQGDFRDRFDPLLA